MSADLWDAIDEHGTGPDWWCIGCGSPHWSGSPEDGCPDCGLVLGVES